MQQSEMITQCLRQNQAQNSCVQMLGFGHTLACSNRENMGLLTSSGPFSYIVFSATNFNFEFNGRLSVCDSLLPMGIKYGEHNTYLCWENHQRVQTTLLD